MRVSAAAVCVAVAQAFVPMPAALRLATGATYVHPLGAPISSLAHAHARAHTPTHTYCILACTAAIARAHTTASGCKLVGVAWKSWVGMPTLTCRGSRN
jgi:hypothetical protein